MAEKEKINPLVANMLKGLLPMIKGHLGNVDMYLRQYLSTIELKNDEKQIAILSIIDKEKAYIITCALDSSDKVVRVVNKMLVSEFIEKILKSV